MPPSPDPRPDRRPALVLCAYEAEDRSWDPASDLVGDAWPPAGVRIVQAPADQPEALSDALRARLAEGDCRALLLIGRATRGDDFLVQLRAENRAASGGAKLTPTGPAMARATAPVADMVRALTDAGLSARTTSEGEDDVGGFLLYSILTGLPHDADAPAVGLLRAPLGVPAETLDRGVRAAAGAIARHLSPLPRFA